jgi:hypothetical protein
MVPALASANGSAEALTASSSFVILAIIIVKSLPVPAAQPIVTPMCYTCSTPAQGAWDSINCL